MNRIASRMSATSFLNRVSASWVLSVAFRGQPCAEDRDRGDVPGWVMITLVTAPQSHPLPFLPSQR